MRLFSWLRPSAPSRSPRGSAPRSVSLGVHPLEDRTVPATFLVDSLADAGAGSLRQAVLDANALAGADVIRFAAGARDGTIALTTGELVLTDAVHIDGTGARRLAVSGSGASRVFRIAAGVTASIDDLTITNGSAALRGGGVRNDGTLTLTRAVVSNNTVTGVPGVGTPVDGLGGGVFNTGNLTVAYSRFEGNRANGGDGIVGVPSSAGLGGAIMSLGSATAPATVSVSHSVFVGNEARGGAAPAGSPFARNALGGAVMNDAGTFTISHSQFHGNRAVGGSSASTTGGARMGGALMNAAAAGDAILNVSHSTFTGNEAIGGSGGAGGPAQIGRGGAIGNFIPPFVPPTTTVRAVITVDSSVIVGNRAVGGSGAVAGNGLGGGLSNENRGSLSVSNTLVAFNAAVGGAGTTGAGGSGLGGGIYVGPANAFGATTLTLEQSVIALNAAKGGTGTTSGAGLGGGVYVGPGAVASATGTGVFWNDAMTSDDELFGILV